MLKKLMSELSARRSENAEVSTRTLELATAALLFEIARADHQDDAREKAQIEEILRSDLGLREDEIDLLVEEAESAVDESVSFYEFTSALNEQLSREERVAVVRNLWRVAYADGSLDKFEEHYVRRIADLMHVSHADFIRTKEDVRTQRS